MTPARRGGMALAAGLAAALAVWPGRPARAADLVIREIAVTNIGSGRQDAELVAAHTVLRPGDTLDRQRVSMDLRKLLDSGRFSDATVAMEPLGTNAVRLVYRLRTRPVLAKPIEITGNEHFRDSRIRDLVGVNAGDPVDDQVLGTGARKVEREYRDDFFPDVEVTWTLTAQDDAHDLVTAELHVAEGRRAKARAPAFIGNEGLSARTLKDVVKPVTWYNPFSWFKRMRYDAQELERQRAALEKNYRDRGYLDARVEDPVVAAQPDGSVVIQYTITEGPCYRLGVLDVRILGTNAVADSKRADISETELRSRVRARPGELAGEGVIRDNAGALRDYYGERGYILTSVRPVYLAEPSNAVMNVRFDITPGNRCHINNIRIHGNTRTRDKVIRRELLVYPGEIYNEVKVRRSERIVNNLGFFSAVRSEPVDTVIPDSKDIAFTVEEKSTGQFMIGAGYSSEDNVMGYMEITQGNFDISGWPFTGAGQKAKLRTQFGSTRSEYAVSLVEPWFLDRRLALGIDLYRTEVDYDDYDLKRLGTAVSLSKPLRGPNRVTFEYRIERNDISNVSDTNRYTYVDPPQDDYYFTQEEDAIKSTLGVKLTHDTRNRPFVPQQGTRAVLGAAVSGGPMGFDTDMVELSAQANHYVLLKWGHVLSLRTRWEVVEGYGDTDELPISERLFIGGGRTIRGYDYRDVGPKVVRTDDYGNVRDRTVGGQSLALGGAEYSIPVVSALRLATFYDIGNVYRDPFEVELGTLASSWGVGLRFDLPGFPVRIDRAWSIEKDSDLTDTDTWAFWIGFE